MEEFMTEEDIRYLWRTRQDTIEERQSNEHWQRAFQIYNFNNKIPVHMHKESNYRTVWNYLKKKVGVQ